MTTALRRIAVTLALHCAAWWLWKSASNIAPEYFARWVVAYAGTALVLTTGLNRLLTSWAATQALLGSVWAAACVKERLLRQPLLAHDVVFFVQNARDNLELLHAYPVLTGAGLALLGMAGVAIGWCTRKERRALDGVRHEPLLRLLLPVLSCFVVAQVWSHVLGESARNRGQRIARGGVDSFVHDVWFIEQLRFNALPRFFESFWEFEIVEHRDVAQAKRFNALTSRAPNAATRSHGTPDILVVLRESHANVRQLWHSATEQPPASPSRWHDWQGELRVHTFGGGTWLTEFSLLAGYSWVDFGNAGSYAPFTLAPRMRECLPVQLRRLGYRTAAFYPVAGTFLNARNAYQRYGFDIFYSSEDLALGTRWQDLTDREMYAAALDRLRADAGGGPIFALILTMRNHGPHDRRVSRLLADSPAEWPDDVSRPVADYLDRQAETERDFNWLRQQWLETKRPRLIVDFGDHWPSLEGAVVSLASRLPPAERPLRRLFRTPLQFTANYPFDHPRETGEIDVAYLGSTILEAAGLEPGPFFSSNRWLRDNCNRQYVDAGDQPLIRGYLTWTHLAQGAWQ